MEGVLYATIAPLLPHYVADLRLSAVKAGLLVGAYPVGTLLGTVPAAWFSKHAPRRSLLIGLIALGLASFGFGLAHAYGLLLSMRLLQGIGGGFAWVGGLALLFRSAPAGQKGAVIGGVLSAAIVGLMIGPLLGGAASEIGTAGVFAAIAAVCLGLALATWSLSPSTRHRATRRGPSERVGKGLLFPSWVLALSALTTGTIEVLLPLRFDVLGLSASLIGVLFFVSASLEAIASPFAGRLSDRVGRYPVINGGMILGALVSLALVVNDELATAVVAVTAVAFVLSAQSAPAAALLSDSVERVGLGQERAAELLNVAWAGGQVLGSLAAGALASLIAFQAPFAALSMAFLLTLVVASGYRTKR